MSKLQSVTFPSAGSHPVELEGVWHLREEEGLWPAAVVCHPHPLGGGTMLNGVVSAIAHALAEAGVLALRFNFRGVGRSGGQHDNGRGEQDDVAGALDWLLAQPQVDPWRVFVAGYSFGAWVALNHAQGDARVAAAAAVGLVAWHYDLDFYEATRRTGPDLEEWQFDPDFLKTFTRPKLIVNGEEDAFSPPDTLRQLLARIPPPKTLHILPGTGHFFSGREPEVARLVAEFLAGR